MLEKAEMHLGRCQTVNSGDEGKLYVGDCSCYRRGHVYVDCLLMTVLTNMEEKGTWRMRRRRASMSRSPASPPTGPRVSAALRSSDAGEDRASPHKYG